MKPVPNKNKNLLRGLREEMRKWFLKVLVIVTFGLFAWFAWPIYGFLSNQYEVARTPWGWHELPQQEVKDAALFNPTYADTAEAAISILAKRRESISAPSISAAIAIDNELAWAGAVGWQNIENQTPATVLTAYRIGSTSKAVGITGLARLVANGQLDLDTPISNYFNTLPNSKWRQFTSKQLASHTAGLAAYEENNDWLGFYQSLALTSDYENPEDALSVFDSANTLYPPGDDFHYSSFDNILLSAVMQNAAEQSFNDLMESLVFGPLGLNSIRPDPSHHGKQEKNLAISYQSKDQQFKPWRKVNLSYKLAAGGYVATPSDLVLLGSAWLNNQFIPPEVRTEFWTPVLLSNGEANEQNYALGFRRSSSSIQGIGEILHLNHGGISKGAQTWLMIIPGHRMSVAISTNRRTEQFFDFADIYEDLLEVFIPASEEVKRLSGATPRRTKTKELLVPIERLELPTY